MSDIPKGFDMTQPQWNKAVQELARVLPPEEEEEEDNPALQEKQAHTYSTFQEAYWSSKDAENAIYLSALHRPYPDSWVMGQTTEHPFWTPEQEEQVRLKYLKFLLTL